ncbi:MAG TPA: hypothetical protein QGF35_07490 [Dehalococcoidia bacterium]|nr:hypothetical protein [Dehalococcoidia bacterium]
MISRDGTVKGTLTDKAFWADSVSWRILGVGVILVLGDDPLPRPQVAAQR